MMTIERVADSDTWWHLETGQHIIESGSVPRTDIFSHFGIENNLEWIAHGWASAVVLYAAYMAGGYLGVAWVPILAILLTLIILSNTLKDAFSTNRLVAAAWMLCLSITMGFVSVARPQIFSYILFALTVHIIASFMKGGGKSIWALPVVSALWVNFHGGSSSLLFTLLGFAVVFNLLPFSFGRIYSKPLEKAKIKTLLSVLGVSILAALLNPHTYKMLLYPAVNMADSRLLSVILEWQSPNFHSPEGILTFAILSAPLLLLLFSEKKISLYDLMLLGAFGFLTLRSLRQIPYFVMAVTPVVQNHLFKLDLKEYPFRWKLNLTASIILILFFLANTVRVLTPLPFDYTDYPYEALETIKEHRPERMLNSYNWGGFLIWKLNHEGIFPFIDGRADIFSRFTFDDYMKLHNASPGWEEIFDKYNFDAVLFETDSHLVRFLLLSGEWRAAFADDKSTFLIRHKPLP